jgi:DNA adenine methylase
MIKPTRPPLRYHGGKWRVSDRIIELMPAHMTYVEPFGGGCRSAFEKISQ